MATHVLFPVHKATPVGSDRPHGLTTRTATQESLVTPTFHHAPSLSPPAPATSDLSSVLVLWPLPEHGLSGVGQKDAFIETGFSPLEGASGPVGVVASVSRSCRRHR